MGEKRYHRAIWLSDIHLGTRGCKAEFLLDFLRSNDSDVLYLVGDTTFGGVTVKAHSIHDMLDGRRLLVMHGDEFDGIIRYARWLAVLGDMSYRFALSDCYCAGWNSEICPP